VGVPEIAPVEASMVRPAGRPVADQVEMVATGELSVAELESGAIVDPETSFWSPGEAMVTVLVMVQVNEAEPEAPEPSVAVRVTGDEPAVVGVPEMVPVDGSMARPAGRPVADHVTAAVDELSVAESVTGVMAEPDRSDWLPGFAADTVLVIVQVNDAEPVAPDPSEAVTVTEQVHAVVGVPVTAPLMTLMVRPAGSPVAPKARVAEGEESEAPTSSWVTGVPDPSDWAPGFVTEIVLVTVHANDVEPENPAPSVAVTVTDDAPAVVGVPLIVPVVALIDRPAGRPVAAQVNVSPDWESVAEFASGVTDDPEADVWAPCPATDTVLAIAHENVAEPEEPEPSVAVSVTEEVPPVVGVPVTAPVVPLIESPVGSPVADHVRVAPDWESEADGVSVATAVPDVPYRVPGFVTVTTFAIVQANVAEPD
jgi:hypothetical protein